CLAMPCTEYKVFSLNHSLHTSFFQVLVDSIWVEGLIDDIGETFGQTPLGTNSRDGGNIETSGRCNSMTSMTRIRHGEDGVLLCG
ncbi:hypothetical protein PAXRUDRAFT_166104, partial [Paxillus rubicundulus Ve08.2h10]